VPDFAKVADWFHIFKRRLKCHLFDAAFKTTVSSSRCLCLAASKAANYDALNLYNCVVLYCNCKIVLNV